VIASVLPLAGAVMQPVWGTISDRRVPPHLRTTGQTLFYGATFGLGSWAGATFFGMPYDYLHVRGMFLAAALTCATALGGLLLVTPSEDTVLSSP